MYCLALGPFAHQAAGPPVEKFCCLLWRTGLTPKKTSASHPINAVHVDGCIGFEIFMKRATKSPVKTAVATL